MENRKTGAHDHDRVNLDMKEQKDITQVDEGLQTLNVAAERNLHLDAATSTRLRRRADIMIMPVRRNSTISCRELSPDQAKLLCFIFSVQFLDSESHSISISKAFRSDRPFRIGPLICNRLGNCQGPQVEGPRLLMDKQRHLFRYRPVNTGNGSTQP